MSYKLTLVVYHLSCPARLLKACIHTLTLFITMIGGCWSVAYSQTPDQLYTQANTQYKVGQFEQAALSYEKILNQGYQTADVYYNLGNCYYKLKVIGKAILNYERAQKLMPDDEDVAHNLKLAQLKTTDKLVPVPQLAITSAFKNFSLARTSAGWSWLAIGTVWLALLSIALFFFILRKTFVLIFSAIALMFSLVFVTLAVKQTSAEDNSGYGILLVKNVVVKSAPDENGNNLFTIHEGIKFQILDAVGSWNKIRLIDGKIGWIEENFYEKI